MDGMQLAIIIDLFSVIGLKPTSIPESKHEPREEQGEKDQRKRRGVASAKRGLSKRMVRNPVKRTRSQTTVLPFSKKMCTGNSIAIFYRL